jgi:hypothetical protein
MLTLMKMHHDRRDEQNVLHIWKANDNGKVTVQSASFCSTATVTSTEGQHTDHGNYTDLYSYCTENDGSRHGKVFASSCAVADLRCIFP